MGYHPTFAAEFEFFLFRETAQSLHQKGFRGLDALAGNVRLLVGARGPEREICHAILDEMEAFGIPIEGLHTETGPGVYEVAIRYDDALAMADKAALFKAGMKQLCARRGLCDVHGQVERGASGLERALHLALERRPSDECVLRRARAAPAEQAREALPRRANRARCLRSPRSSRRR